jgi:hypothetical protein
MEFQKIAEGLSPETLTLVAPRIEMLFRALGEQSHQDKLRVFAELNNKATKGGIIFAGDSITEGFTLPEFFPRDLPLYNRGIGGITSKQLLDDIDTHITGLAPSKVFILIGTNDLGGDVSPEEIATNIREICKTVTMIDSKVFLISVFPVNNEQGSFFVQATNDKRNNEAIKQLNRLLCEIQGVIYTR